MATIALIPSFKPDSKLVSLVEALKARGIEGVVVDDGSGEDSSPIFAAIKQVATVIGYTVNRGKGHALKTGMDYIRTHYPSDSVVVTVDADGQHSPEDVLRCAEAVSSTSDTIVLGCRSFDGKDVPLKSRLGNIITRAVYRLASGVYVSDTQTGLRAFSAKLISFFLTISGDRYEYEMNVLLACPTNHVSIREVPIETIYENNNESSHFRPIQDSARIYAGILTFAASSFISFLVDYNLYALFTAALFAPGAAGIAIANISARLISATLNFFINRTVVFKSTEPLGVTAVRYAMLAATILSFNTVIVVSLSSVLGIHTQLAKLIAEIVCLFASWIIQNRFVFARKEY